MKFKDLSLLVLYTLPITTPLYPNEEPHKNPSISNTYNKGLGNLVAYTVATSIGGVCLYKFCRNLNKKTNKNYRNDFWDE